MNCSIPAEFEQRLAERAVQRQTSVQELVNEALAWYLQLDEELLGEF